MSGSLRVILLRRFHVVILVYLGSQIPDLLQSGKIFHCFDGRNFVFVWLLAQIGMDLGINGLWPILNWVLWDVYPGFQNSLQGMERWICPPLFRSHIFTKSDGIELDLLLRLESEDLLRFEISESSVYSEDLIRFPMRKWWITVNLIRFSQRISTVYQWAHPDFRIWVSCDFGQDFCLDLVLNWKISTNQPLRLYRCIYGFESLTFPVMEFSEIAIFISCSLINFRIWKIINPSFSAISLLSDLGFFLIHRINGSISYIPSFISVWESCFLRFIHGFSLVYHNWLCHGSRLWCFQYFGQDRFLDLVFKWKIPRDQLSWYPPEKKIQSQEVRLGVSENSKFDTETDWICFKENCNLWIWQHLIFRLGLLRLFDWFVTSIYFFGCNGLLDSYLNNSLIVSALVKLLWLFVGEILKQGVSDFLLMVYCLKRPHYCFIFQLIGFVIYILRLWLMIRGRLLPTRELPLDITNQVVLGHWVLGIALFFQRMEKADLSGEQPLQSRVHL